ncbi:quinone-interacting membrane-bound oxidoreductase complex subunit QmoC [Fundidesulfovibrio soli]|uniref:quinone-interacting membrane-bound oxidoreductase complex subunit QmoC n=1 Tax=Fundidesulfovibrio soli TaxID=2922716 RepID=UPI001FAEFF0F|nr:quinone-interacting membrane-bound oxidoreductase complex subunit QmoC [Fundidesulfovibrio soli]
MSSPVRIQPDPSFVRELQAAGGENVKKCYQCATCSVACPLSPAENPYPRKEMVWAQWGLKDKLMNDIDVWLCHNCGTCSDLCPRGAKPADTLAAIRNMTYRKLVGPAKIGEWMSSSKGLPYLAGIPAVLWLFIWLLTTGLSIPAGEIKFAKVFPGDFTIDPLFGAVAVFVAWSFYKGVTNMWKSFASLPTTFEVGAHCEKPTLVQAIIDVLRDDLYTHRQFNECGADNTERSKGHWALLAAFVALGIVTSIVAVSHWGSKVPGFGWLHVLGDTPMALYSPVKLLAIVGTVLGFYGLTMLTRRRLNLDAQKQGSSFYDWYLLGVIWAVFVTGLGSMVLRLAGVAGLAYPMYYLHLVAVFMMIAYLPWSKLGHLVYRTTALVYARMSGRKPLTRVEDKIFEI